MPNLEEHIKIGLDRHITVPESLKRIAVQYDHNVETVTFDCPRYWDGHDMSKMTVYINYMRKDRYRDKDLAENVTIDETDNDTIHFTWTLSRNATLYKGELRFLVCIVDLDDKGNEKFHWNSELNTQMYVSEGLECDDAVKELHSDIITDLLLRMDKILVATTPILDKTLTESGLAADAKVTGDRISNLDNEFRSSINSETIERKAEINVERERINSLAKLKAGSTSGDAELIDIRAGFDGKVYDNAGDAVRSQIGDNRDLIASLTSAFEDIETLRINEKLTVNPAYTNHYINSETGKMVSSEIRCTSDYVYVPKDSAVLVTTTSNYKVSSYNWYDAKLRYLGATRTHPNGIYLRLVVCGAAEPSPSIAPEEAISNVTIELVYKNPYVRKVAGKNKLDVNKSVAGYFNNVTTPTIMPSTTYETTEFIDISGFEHNVCISPRMRKYIEYDEHFGMISDSFVNAETANAIVTPNPDAKYIRVTYYTNDRDSVQIEDGTECTVYEQFEYSADENIGLNERQKNEVKNIASSFLKGKVGLSFGDSIMYGAGNDGVGILDILSSVYGIEVNDYSESGASCGLISGRKHIVAQIESAIDDGIKPDFILIDGLSNDIVNGTIGSINSDFNYEARGYSTFADGLQYCFGLIRNNYPTVPIVYVLPHSSKGRDYELELEFGELARKICQKWSVPIADVYKNGNVSARIPLQLQAYTRYPEETTGTHPNRAGYEHSYIPLVYSELKRIFEK